MENTPSSLPFIGNFLPKKMMSTKATAGIIGITQACSKNQPDEATTSEVIS